LLKVPGTFLVRFSQSTADNAGAFAITRITKQGDPISIRISQDKNGFWINRDATYPDLGALINDFKKTLYLKHPCQV